MRQRLQGEHIEPTGVYIYMVRKPLDQASYSTRKNVFAFRVSPEASARRQSLPAGKSARRLLPGGSLCPPASQPGGFCPEAVFARRQVSPEAVFAAGKSARRLLPGGSLCLQASQPGGFTRIGVGPKAFLLFTAVRPYRASHPQVLARKPLGIS